MDIAYENGFKMMPTERDGIKCDVNCRLVTVTQDSMEILVRCLQLNGTRQKQRRLTGRLK